MPLLKPRKNEGKSKFINRFMRNKRMRKEFVNNKKLLAIAYNSWGNNNMKKVVRRKRVDGVNQRYHINVSKKKKKHKQVRGVDHLKRINTPSFLDYVSDLLILSKAEDDGIKSQAFVELNNLKKNKAGAFNAAVYKLKEIDRDNEFMSKYGLRNKKDIITLGYKSR